MSKYVGELVSLAALFEHNIEEPPADLVKTLMSAAGTLGTRTDLLRRVLELDTLPAQLRADIERELA
jgi:hypothetical protein